ncbi:MAG: hypothetical protein WDW36_005453 [Sanguina aurantia]
MADVERTAIMAAAPDHPASVLKTSEVAMRVEPAPNDATLLVPVELATAMPSMHEPASVKWEQAIATPARSAVIQSAPALRAVSAALRTASNDGNDRAPDGGLVAPTRQPMPDARTWSGPPFELPSLDLLTTSSEVFDAEPAEVLAATGELIEQRLREFKVPVTVVGASAGPVITRYEVEPAVGVRGSQIVALMRDLARGLGRTSIRVVETIPGKTCMGLELPNEHRQMIGLADILCSDAYRDHDSPLALAMGKDINAVQGHANGRRGASGGSGVGGGGSGGGSPPGLAPPTSATSSRSNIRISGALPGTPASRNLLFAGLASAEDDSLSGRAEASDGGDGVGVTQRGGGAVPLPPAATADGWSQLGGGKGVQQQQQAQQGCLAPPLGSDQPVHGSARSQQAEELQ